MRVLGKGETGCVISDYISAYCSPEVLPNAHMFHEEPMVTKVYKSRFEFEEDKEKAERLSEIDPRQTHFVYPIAFCTVRATEEIKDVCGMDVDTVYMSEMRDAGKSLKDLAEEGVTFPAHKVQRFHDDILEALALLERRYGSHGDLHAGNVMILDGHPVLIDFGNPKLDRFHDIKDFTTLILPMLARITEEGEYKRELERKVTAARKRVFSTLQALDDDPVQKRPSPKRKLKGTMLRFDSVENS